MRAAQVLFSQGFGSRRDCAALLASGAVQRDGRTITDPDEELPTTDLVLQVHGQPWPYQAKALLMLHKPAGFECSRQPRHHPSVLGLLPAPLRQRGVQPVGRLDADTTGLLLLTDDGAALHRLTHPKHHVHKVYEVDTTHPVSDALLERLLSGVQLHDDPAPVRALDCQHTGPSSLRLTLAEGRYHQVKRMVAAAGNRVRSLHRSAFGPLQLPADLAPRGWRWLDDGDRRALGLVTAPAGPASSHTPGIAPDNTLDNPPGTTPALSDKPQHGTNPQP